MTIPSEITDADYFEKYYEIWKKNEELLGIRKPPFCNNIACTTKLKTHLI